MVYNFGAPWKCEAEVNSVTTSAFRELVAQMVIVELFVKTLLYLHVIIR